MCSWDYPAEYLLDQEMVQMGKKCFRNDSTCTLYSPQILVCKTLVQESGTKPVSVQQIVAYGTFCVHYE